MKTILFVLTLLLYQIRLYAGGSQDLFNYNDSTAAYIISVSIDPVFSEAVDAKMRHYIDSLKTDFLDTVEELKVIDYPHQLFLEVNSEESESVIGLSSTLLTTHIFTGGAHPNTFYKTWTYTQSDGKMYLLEDFFKEDSQPLLLLYGLVRERLITILDINTEETDRMEWIEEGTGESDFDNYRYFVLKDEILTIIFPPYQVAPYCYGTQEVEIPLEEIAEILKPEFRP